MHADAFFRMGSTHSVCQDYAVAGERGGVVYAIVSDGCSGIPTGVPGSPFTDFGARFLVRAAERFLLQPEGSDTRSASAMIISAADAMRRTAGLPMDCLDATLTTAQVVGSYCLVHQIGDGVVAARRHSGEYEYYWSAYDQNMPFYLSYTMDANRRADWLRECGRETLYEQTIERGFSATQRALGENFSKSLVFEAALYDLVVIMSDGAESFYRPDGTQVPLAEVIEQVFAIKGFAGQFMARRCGRFLSSFCAERGWKHADDFSVAGIYLGEL